MARFTFEQSGAGADRVIAVGVSDLAATTDGVSLEQGSGAIVITEDGVAGFVTGVVGVAGGGFSLGGGVGLRFNTTGGAVDETVTVGGKNLVISFDHDQGELFALFGAGLSLKVGNFVTIEGDISFETGANGSSTFGANNALVFLGRGPLLTDANEANENPAATGVLLRDATIGVVRIDGANATYAISATGRIEVVGVDGVVVDGTATVIFNNTGAAATQTITFVNSQGLTENFVVDVADQARAFSAIDIKLDVLGQRLVGDFAFDVASTADGEEVTVGFENVDFALGDGTNNIVSVEDAEGAFLLNADGIAGSASTGTVTVDVGDGVAQTLGTSVELLINTTGEQVTRTLTPLAPAGAAAIEIDVEAGPFVRLSVEGASLDIAGQQLGGNFTFELATERTVVDGVETESTSVVLGVTQGTMVLGSDTDTVTVSAAEGLFVISNDGVAGSATATVRLSTAHASLLAPAPGSPATTFSLAINTTGEAVSRSLEVGGIVVNLDVQAGPFIRVAGENVLLEVNVSGTQTLSLGGNFAFEAGTDADGATVLAAAATNVKFTLGTGDLLTLDNGSGFFVLTQAGVAARGFADVTASPSTGVELAGTFGFEVNTTGQLVQQTFDVGGTEQPIDVDKGPFVQIIAISALILLAGVQLSAQKLALRKSAAGISITGQNAGFSVSAGDKHIIGVSKADFAFELMDDGIAGALRRGTVAGPDFGGDLTIEGVVEFDINTTTDAETVFVVDSSQDISTPALLATATEEIEVLAGTTIKVSGTDAATPAKIEIVGNELTASELLFTKVGNAVEIEGTNLGFSLQVGGTEVLGLTAGNFFLNIDDDGVVGGTTGGSISFTPDPDVSFTAAAVSLAVNTKLTAQSVDLDSDPLTAPTILPGAPLGSPFVRIEATAADLTILGSVLSADRFSFEKEGARIAVEGDNVDLVLKAGTTQVLAIADADLGLEFSSTGVAGAIQNAAFTGPSLGNVSLDLTATASVRFNTGDLETSVMVGGVEVDLAAGSFFEAEIENAELTTDGVTLTADLLTFAQNDDVVEVTGTNIDFAISTAAADIVKVTDADFTARFTEAGLAAATTGGTIDFSGATAFDLAISGEVSVAINTTPDDATIVIVDDTLAVPTSTTVELLAGPYAQVAITNAVFSIEGSELTADRIAVTMTAGQVTAEGTNLDLLINAGATRVLGILDANFELVIQDAGAGSTAGIAGRLSNATILGPDLGDDFSIQGDVSVEFNTTDAIQTLGSGASIGTQPGGSYVAATLTPTAADPDAPLLTIAGVAIGADKVSFEYIASETTPTVNVAVDMLNVNFGDAVTVTADSASLTINGDGVTGTVQNVSIDVVTADDVGTDRAVAFTGNASLVIDTTASSPFVRAEIAGIDANTSAELLVAGQRLTGNYVIERFETLEGEEIVRVTATNAGLELTDTSGTVASITNGTGFLVITDLGIAGSMTVTADFGGTAANGEERFGLTVGKVEVEVNTTNVAVSQNVRVNGEMLDFELNAGPYVRVALTDAVLTVGLLAISGNLTFEQQGATAADTVTVVAFSSVSLEVDPTADPPNENTDKLAVTNARGAFIFDADGFAGLLSGDVEVAVEGFGLGGSVGLRINTRDTGITRTITAGGEVLEIAFTSDEVATVNAPFVDVFGGSVSLVIGDFVSIEADATWSADTLTATNVVLFVGSGPLFLEDDQGERTAEINPLAVGLRIFDADLKVTQSGDTYLMLAYGTLDLVGVQNADITGSVRLEINTTANDASVEVLDDTPAVRGSALIEAGVVRVIGTDLTVAVGSQEFSADLSFEKADDGTITVGVTNTTIILASGAFTLKQGEDQSGVLIFGSTGIAGSIEVAVEAGTNTTGLEFEANITAAFNSSSGPVSSPLLTAPLPAGPYVRAEITGIDGNLAKLTVSDQEFEGNFALEVIDSDPNGPTVRVVATGVTAKFGDGTNELISLINGSGYVIVKGSGVAVSVEGQIIVNDIEGVSFAGAFAVEVNTTGAAVKESFVLGDSTETLVLEDAEFVRIKGNDVSLTIAGQTISGSFVVETVEDTDTKTMVVAVAITDAQLRFSDGTTDFATATQTAGSTGLVLVRRDASSTAVAPVNQLAGSFAAKIVLSVPDVEFDVDIALSFNTSADAASAKLDINDGIANNPIALSIAGGPFVKGVIGTTAAPAKLTVEGQTIEGIFGVEVREDTNDASTVTISVNDAKLAFGPDPLAPLVTFEADEGLFIINDAGFAGSIDTTIKVAADDVAIDGQASIQVNTGDAQVTQMFEAGGETTVLNVPAGPYVRVDGALDFNVLGQKLSGSFAFEAAGNDVSITASNVSASFGVGIAGDVANPFVGVKFSGGAGLLVLNNDGLVASLSGRAELIGVDGIVLSAEMRLDLKSFFTAAPLTFTLPNEDTIELDAGDEYVKITGETTIDIVDAFELAGEFAVTANLNSDPAIGAEILQITARGVSVFVGVPDGAGVQVSDGEFALTLTKTADPSLPDFDVNVAGKVSLAGLGGAITASGDVVATATGRTVANERITSFVIAGTVDINTVLGTFTGSLEFTRDGNTSDVMASGTGISYFIGSGSIDDTATSIGFGIDAAQFDLALKSDGTHAFKLSGDVRTVGLDGIQVSGLLAVEQNTHAVDLLGVEAGSLQVGGELVLVVTDPSVRLEGSFAIEKSVAGPDGLLGNDDDVPELFIAATGVRVAVQTDAGIGFEVADGELALLLTEAGFAFDASGSVALIGVTGVAVEGTFGAQLNTLKDAANQDIAVSRSITVGGTTKVLDLGEGIARFSGQDIKLIVADQVLTGSFVVAKSPTELTVSVSDAHFALGSENRPFVELTNGAGDLVINDQGMAARITGSVVVDIPGVEVDAVLELEINQGALNVLGLDAADYIRVRAQSAATDLAEPAKLVIADQTITGVFLFEQTTVGTEQIIKVAATDVAIDLSVVQITGASGAIVITSTGVAGMLSIDSLSLNDIPGITAEGSAEVYINTNPTAVIESFDLGDVDPLVLDLPAGPFVRVEVTVAENGLQLDIGGDIAAVTASGIVAVERKTRDDGSQVTIVGIRDFAASVTIGGPGGATAEVINGVGSFVVVPSDPDTNPSGGIAGLITAEASIDIADAASAGGALSIRMNTSGLAVDETITVGGRDLPIRFGDSERNVFQISITGLSLNIGDFVTVEGDITWDGDTFAGANLEVFLGQGPVRLDNGDINPLATGVLLTNATIALRRSAGKYALSALGTISVVGIADVSISGTAQVRFSNLGIGINTDEILTIPGSDTDVVLLVDNGVAEFTGTDLAITVFGQQLRGDFTFSKTGTGQGSTVTVVAENVSANFGGGAVTLANGAGGFVLSAAGVAAAVSGDVTVTTPNVSFEGTTPGSALTFALEVNNTGAADAVLGLDAGNYLRLEADGKLIIAGQTLGGTFAIEQVTNTDGASITRIAARNVTMNLGGVVDLAAGSGSLLITDAGIAARIAGTVAITADGIDTAGATFTVAINTMTTAVDETFRVDGEDITLVLPAAVTGPYVRVEATDVNISIGGQALRGDFAFEKTSLFDGTDAVLLAVANVELVLGDAGTASLSLTNGEGALLVLPTGVAGSFAADLAVAIPDVTIRGSVKVELNQTGVEVHQTFLVGTDEIDIDFGPLEAADFVRVAIRNGELDIFGQTLTGNFVFAQSAPGIEIAASNIGLNLGDGVVTVSNGSGAFLSTADGVAGALTGNVAFGIDDISVAATLTIEVNTTGAAVIATVGDVGLDLDAGQYVRVFGQQVVVDIFGQSVTGDFTFEQATTVDGASVVRVAVAAVTLTISTGTGATAEDIVTVTSGEGAFLLTDAGAAGTLSVSAALTIPGMPTPAASVDNVTISFNLTPAPVTETFVIPGVAGSTTVELDLPAGKFFQVTVIGLTVDLDGVLDITGDFSITQSTNDDGSATTALGITNFSDTFDTDELHGADGLECIFDAGAALYLDQTDSCIAVTDVEGAFVITEAGVAGVVSGHGIGTLGVVAVEGTVSVRINKTGAAVDETVQVGARSIPIRFGEDEGDLIAVSVSDVTLRIGDFVEISGDVSFTGNTFAGTNLEIFLGDGPARLESGDINPLATGVLLTDATIGLVKVETSTGDEYALQAVGTVQFIGIEGVTISGTAVVAVNTTGMAINESLVIEGSSADPVAVVFETADRVTKFEALNANLSVAGQSLVGSFSFDQSSDGTLRIAATEVSLTLGDGTNGIAVTDAGGTLLVTPAGAAGQLQGTVELSFPDMDISPEAKAAFAISINTTMAPVNETFTVGTETLTLDLPVGPFIRVEATDITLAIAGQSLSGNFAFEQSTNTDGTSLVTVALTNVSLSLGAADEPIATLTNGEGLFVVKPAGLAGRLAGTVEVAVPGDGFVFTGTFGIEVNTTNQPVEQVFVIGDEIVTLTMDRANAVRVVGTNVSLAVAGQTLTADFAFEQVIDAEGVKSIRVAVTNGAIDLGDGLVTVSNIEGALFIFEEKVTPASIGVTRLAATLSADVAFDLPNVEFVGDFGITINTSTEAVDTSFVVGATTVDLAVDAGPYLQVTGTNVRLTVLGQSLSGDFSVTQTTDTTTSTSILVVTVDKGSINLGGGTALVQVTDIAGSITVTNAGIAASLAAQVDISLPGITLSSAFLLEINTGTDPVANDLVNLPGGQFLRLSATGVDIDVVGQQLRGDFTIEQLTQTGGSSLTRIAVANVSLDLGDGLVQVTNGNGFFVLSGAGAAGRLAATVSVTIPDVSFSGSFELEVNTTTAAVDEVIRLGASTTTLSLPVGPYLRVAGTDVRLTLGTQSISGDFAFEQITTDDGPLVKIAATNVGLAINDGSTDLLTLSNGTGTLVVLPTSAVAAAGVTGGIAGIIEGTVALGITGASLIGTLRVEFNKTGDVGQSIDETFQVGGETVTLELEAGNYVTVAGTNIALEIAGQRLSGDFSFTQKNIVTAAGGTQSVLEISFSNVVVAFGDGTTDYVVVSNGNGDLYAAGDELWGQFDGEVAVNIPDVDITGAFKISLNNTAGAKQLVTSAGTVTVATGFRIEAINPTIDIAGQTISASKVSIGQDSFDDSASLAIVVTDLVLAFGPAGAPIITATADVASLLITPSGIAAHIKAGVTVVLPGTLGLIVETAWIRINTGLAPVTAEELSLTVDTDFGPDLASLDLAPGPFFEVAIKDSTLTIGSAPDELTIGADFYFRQLTQEDGTEVTFFAVDKLTFQFDANNGVQNGTGAFLILPADPAVAGSGGVVALISGDLKIGAGGSTSGGASLESKVGVELNTTRLVVNESVTVAGRTFVFDMPASGATVTDPYVNFALENVSLKIADFLIIEGDSIAYTTVAGGQEIVLEGVSAFVGQGPALIDTGTVDLAGDPIFRINPAAQGVYLSNLYGYVLKFTDGTFLMYAEGDVEILGLPGVTVAARAQVQIFTGTTFVDKAGVKINAAGDLVTLSNDTANRGNAPFRVIEADMIRVGLSGTTPEPTLTDPEPALNPSAEISIAGQTLRGTMAFEKVGDTTTLILGGADPSEFVELALGGDGTTAGSPFVVKVGQGEITLDPAGAVAAIRDASASIKIPGSTNVEVTNVSIYVNTQSVPVVNPLDAAETLLPGVRVEATTDLTLFEQKLSGTFTFEQVNLPATADPTGAPPTAVRVGASNVSLELGATANTPAIVSLAGGSGLFLITDAGFAGTASGNVTLAVPGLDEADFVLIGDFSLALNTSTAAVAQQFEINGETKILNVPAGPYLRIAGNDVDVRLLGQRLSGNFSFEKAGDAIKFAVSDVSLGLGDGTTDFVSLTGGEGAFIITPKSAPTATDGGLAGRIGGTVNVTIPNVDLEGTFTLSVNGTEAEVDETFNVGAPTLTQALAVRDVNGDNIDDLVIGTYGQQNKLFLGLAGGAGFEASEFEFSVEDNTTAILLADIDGDLDLDLIVGNSGETNLTYENLGGVGAAWLGFGAANEISVDAKNTTALVLADIDDDGHDDLVVANLLEANRLYLGDGTGGFGAGSDIGDENDPTSSIAVSDLNGDGLLDIVVGNRGLQNRVYINGGEYIDTAPDPDVVTRVTFLSPVAVGAEFDDTNDITIGDVDGADSLDIVVVNDGENAVYLLDVDTATITVALAANTTLGNSSVAAFVAQLQGVVDAAIDAMSGADELGLVAGDIVVELDGDDIVIRLAQTATTAGITLGSTTAAAAELNLKRDEEDDTALEVDYAYSQTLDIVRILSADVITFGDAADNSTAVELVDVDVDGDLDFVVTNNGSLSYVYLRNGATALTDTASFAAAFTTTAIGDDTDDPSNANFSAATTAVAVRDLDGQGNLDIVTGQTGDNTIVFLNNTDFTGSAVGSTVSIATNEIRLVLPAGKFLRLEGTEIDLTVAGQTLTGNFAFEQKTKPNGQRVVVVAVTDAQLNLGDGLAVATITEGALVITPTGIGGKLSATVDMDLGNALVLDDARANIEINNTNAIIRDSIVVNGDEIVVDLPAGPYVRVEILGAETDVLNTPDIDKTVARLTIAGIELAGKFVFEQTTNARAETIVKVALSDISFGFGPVMVSNGSGFFVVLPTGLAGTLQATVDVTVPGVAVSGTFGVEINNTGAAVEESVVLDGVTKTLDLVAGPYVRATGVGVSIGIAGVTLSGNFGFEQVADTSLGAAPNAKITAIIADNVTLDLGTDVLEVFDGSGFFLITSAGIAGALAVSARINAGSAFGLEGRFALEINQTGATVNQTAELGGETLTLNVGAEDVLAVEVTGVVPGSPAVLTVAGQTLKVDLVRFTQTVAAGVDGLTGTADDETTITIDAQGIQLDLGPEDGPAFVEVRNGVAVFEITSEGLAGFVTLTDGAAGPAFKLAAGPVTAMASGATILINTRPTAATISSSGTSPVSFDLAGGQFIKVEVLDLKINLDFGITPVVLQGRFTFEQSTVDGATVLKVAVAGVRLDLLGDSTEDPNDGTVVLSNGTGGLLIDDLGLAASISATVSVNAGIGFSFTGTFGLSINNRITVDATDTVAAIDGAVSETFIFGDNIVDLDLPAGPFLRIEGSGIEMNLGGQAIKANFSFEKSTSKVVTNPNRADGVAPTYGAERDVIKVAVSGLEFAIGDGTTDFVVVSGGTGNVVLTNALMAPLALSWRVCRNCRCPGPWRQLRRHLWCAVQQHRCRRQRDADRRTR